MSNRNTRRNAKTTTTAPVINPTPAIEEPKVTAPVVEEPKPVVNPTPAIEETETETETETAELNGRHDDDPAKKGPYATEANARANQYRNKGPKQWELYEINVPVDCINPELREVVPGLSVPTDDTTDIAVFVWEVNYSHALALVARKMGMVASIAGQSKRGGNGLKAVNAKLTAELDAQKQQMAAILAKLKAAGIEM